ncbi:putative neutral sphingomyelinase [Watersipora subatra]|uniref:putative neutral sphingomyelinase n=1 Tax=Watersipora subatra TaxID=2589382 RepID=UPI00355BAA19
MESSLNVLTMNVWGVRMPILGSKLIDQRISAIAELVNKNNYDVVIFQELFDSKDQVALSCKLIDSFPHTHSFHGSWIGTGLVVFSRYPIVETMFHAYPVNGHAHKIFHGDWYAGKGCALAVLKVNELTINLYITHMHARYNLKKELDEYAGHRAHQALYLSQFIKHTSSSCDAVLAAGDFNSTPNEVAYKVIRSNAVLDDAWLLKNMDGSHTRGYTSDTPGNCFTPPSVTAELPEGQRIDYIFYRANEQTALRLESSRVLTDKIPGTDIDYSDHYGLEAKMFVKRSLTAGQVPNLDVGVRQGCLKDISLVLDEGAKRARSSKYYYFVTMILCLMVLLLCRERYTGNAGNFLHTLLEMLQGVLAVMSGLSLWTWFITCICEENEFRAAKGHVEKLLKAGSVSRVKKE